MPKTVRLITDFFGKYNPASIEGYEALGGFTSLKRLLKEPSQFIIDEIVESGMLGRGGAAYPTGVKLEQSAAVKGDHKVVICNADEGEPGTFKDREILRQDPFKVIEGIILCAYATQGTEGYIYIREEYSHLHAGLRNAVEACRLKGYLGKNILGSGLNFDIRVFSGAGAYVCGEGGALIESIEGKQGKPRNKPPYTKERGLWQLPTLMINVESLAAVTTILLNGANTFTAYGTDRSKGTKVISVSGKINKPGVYEVPFGITFNEIIYDLAGGIKGGKKAVFLQIGGASGPIVPASKFDVKLCYQKLKENGFDMGSGAIVVADESVSLAGYLETIYEFFQEESCGKCTPCREGNRQIARLLKDIAHGHGGAPELDRAVRYAMHMKEISFCGLGKTAPMPLLTAVNAMRESIFTNKV